MWKANINSISVSYVKFLYFMEHLSYIYVLYHLFLRDRNLHWQNAFIIKVRALVSNINKTFHDTSFEIFYWFLSNIMTFHTLTEISWEILFFIMALFYSMKCKTFAKKNFQRLKWDRNKWFSDFKMAKSVPNFRTFTQPLHTFSLCKCINLTFLVNFTILKTSKMAIFLIPLTDKKKGLYEVINFVSN